MKQYSSIINSRLSQGDVTLTAKQLNCVNLAIVDCVVAAIENYKSNEAKAINKEAVGLFPSIWHGEITLYIRNFYFKRAKKQALLRANTENRKCYVIRKTDISYIILSTLDVDHNKRVRILGKEIGAKELTEKADFVAYPEVKPVKPVRVLHRNK